MEILSNLNLFAASLCISITFLCCFFGVLSLRMTRTQMMVCIFTTIVWGYVLGGMTWYAEESSYLISIIIEFGYMVLFVRLFANGNFWHNCFCVMVCSWLVNGMNLLCFSLIDYEAVNNLYQTSGGYLQINVWEIFVMALANIIFIIPVSIVVKRVIKNDGNLEAVYSLFYVLFFIVNVIQGIIQIYNGEGYESFYSQHNIIYCLYAVLCIAIIILIFLYMNRMQTKVQEKQLQRVLEMAKKQYEISIEKNKAYHMVRHEWNRKINEIKNSSDVMSRDFVQMVNEEMETQARQMILTPYSGNIYLDMVLQDYDSKFFQKSIVFEIHLEVRNMEKFFGMKLAQMIDEMLQYVYKKENIEKWCVLSIHKKVDYWLVKIEYNHAAGNKYYLRKIEQMIGNNLLIRQQLISCQAMCGEKEGTIFYRYGKEKSDLAVMVKEK